MSWKEDRREKEIFCDKCGQGILDISTCKVYRSGPPYYDNIYICAECSGDKKHLMKKNVQGEAKEDDDDRK